MTQRTVTPLAETGPLPSGPMPGPGPASAHAASAALEGEAGRVAPSVPAHEPQPADAPARDTILDSSLDEGPAIPGLDMRRQRDEVHARLFGRAGEPPRDERPDPPHDPPAQHHIGRYLVQGTLGQGGMGKVLRAHDETLGRDVALKVLHESRRGSLEQRLLREAQALARLSHPNVVRVYDVGDIDGRVCMAMELVHGTPLDQWQREPRPWAEVLEVYRQAGRGLAAAHAEGLVHRDFKPANCILDAQGTVKVLDFGLARGVGSEGEALASEFERTHGGESQSSDDGVRASRSQSMLEQALTRTGTMLGTLAYMAPEQLMGKPADPRSDQFAFCVSLYEALHGTRPFSGATAMAILYAIQSKPPAMGRPRAGLAPVPKWLHELLRRGLSVASHQRFADMDALLAVVERGLARGRRARAAVGAVLVAALGGAVAMGSVLQGERPCDGLRSAVMPAWTDTERVAVGAGIEAAGLAEGHRVRERVEARLDAYASAWTEARADACEATWVRREAGEQALARRMACLDERVVHVRAVVEQLAHADPRAAAFATATVEALPSLAPCADVDALLRGPEPVPPALAEQAAGIRELVARSWAAGASGDEVGGVDAADRALSAAEPLTDAPVLRLEALHNRGHLRRTARRWAEARQDLEAALELAEQLDDAARASDVLGELVLLAHEERDTSTAQAWLTTFRGKLLRLDPEPRREAVRWRLEGLVALRDERLDDALAAATRAVELQAGLEARVDVEHVEASFLLAEVQRERGDLEAAGVTLEGALALAEDGGLLPLVGDARHRLGYLGYARGDLDAARMHLEAAMTVFGSFYRTQTITPVRTQLLLAQVLHFQGDVERSFEEASLAWRSLDERVSPSLRGEVANLLGSLHQSKGEIDDAIARYRDARAAWESVPKPDRIGLAMLDSNTADCLAAKGDVAAALVLYDGALAVLTVDAPADDPRRAYPLFGRGMALLGTGQRDAGLASLRAALALRAALEQDPPLAAELRWELGRALVATDRPSAALAREAGALVHQARAAFAGAGFDDRVAELDAWLARCGPACAPQPQAPASHHL